MIQLTREQVHALIAHARDTAPNEACGIIGGKENRALKIYPLKNTHATPRVNFYADPLELLAAFRDIEANGWEHIAVYHSHPASDAFPSATDIAQAYYPDVVHLIISLVNAEQPIVRAFRIVEGQVQEVALVTKDE
jgi:proteasome lid subunit RPN8/RPN11